MSWFYIRTRLRKEYSEDNADVGEVVNPTCVKVLFHDEGEGRRSRTIPTLNL
jgi:hypothetical protein